MTRHQSREIAALRAAYKVRIAEYEKARTNGHGLSGREKNALLILSAQHLKQARIRLEAYVRRCEREAQHAPK